MSRESNGCFQNYLNLSNQRDWIQERSMSRVVEEGEFQQLPQVVVPKDPPPIFHAAGGMLTEFINFPSSSWHGKTTNSDMLISQIQSNHGWSDKYQIQSELSLMATKASSSNPHQENLIVNSIAPQFTWVSGNNPAENEGINRIGNFIESQGLSLSLSSKFEDLKMRNGTSEMYSLMNEEILSLAASNNHIANKEVIHVGYAASHTLGLLRHSRYLKAAQELLDEFCYLGKGNFKNNNQRVKKDDEDDDDDDENPNDDGSKSSSFVKERQSSLSASGRSDCQRKKTKLISMLDEVNERYTRYCDRMQAMENSFCSVLVHGAANTYTTLARKAMSRHFRCLKDAIVDQLKLTYELLGDKDLNALTGLTKGETPRLRFLDQKFRQQKSFHQIGMLTDSEAWRPQRGLPERSVNVLRAWLFEHFLHPYPCEADKHVLSRQTGLSKNQVSNWFINARVRLWKPMVEEMYQQETRSKDNEQETSTNTASVFHHYEVRNDAKSQQHQTSTTHMTGGGGRNSEIKAIESDPSRSTINFSQYTTLQNQHEIVPTQVECTPNIALDDYTSSNTAGDYIWRVGADNLFNQVGNTNMVSPFVKIGNNAQGGGDQVSLSLGLKYSSSHDFGSY